MKLPKEELDKTLLSNKYNKANLREFLRRSVRVANDEKDACEYALEKYNIENDSVEFMVHSEIREIMEMDPINLDEELLTRKYRKEYLREVIGSLLEVAIMYKKGREKLIKYIDEKNYGEE